MHLETSAAPQAKTRAQVLRDKVVIRLATNAAGPEIAAVLKENGLDLPGVDWSQVNPYWLIATVDDDVIGCCQVLIAKPFGFLDFIFVRKSAKFKFRAIAIRKLLQQGIRTLEVAGCSYAGGFVSEKNAKMMDVVQQIAKPVGKCELMVKRLMYAG